MAEDAKIGSKISKTSVLTIINTLLLIALAVYVVSSEMSTSSKLNEIGTRVMMDPSLCDQELETWATNYNCESGKTEATLYCPQAYPGQDPQEMCKELLKPKK
jgi:hypothetical protein